MKKRLQNAAKRGTMSNSIIHECERVGLPALLFMYRQKANTMGKKGDILAKGKNTVAVVAEAVQPIADTMGLVLWDVRFEKEGATWYLRLFIEKEGGVTISDCENFSRAADKLLDEVDPIDQSYVLEVGSPGTEREMRKDWHFQKYLGSLVNIRLIRPVEGQRDFIGALTGYENDEITILLDDSLEMQIALAETAYVKLYDDYTDVGGLEE